MNLRLLIICSAFPPTRAPESGHALFLCEHLARAGVEVHLLTSKGNTFNGPLPSGVRVHAIMDNWSWTQLIKLLYFIRSNRFDTILLIYIDWIYQWHPMITFLPTFARRLCRARSVVTQLENENGLSGMRSNKRVGARLMRGLIAWFVDRKDVHPSYGTLLRDSSHIIALSALHLDAFAVAYSGVRAKAEIIPAPSFVRIPDEDAGSARGRGREVLRLQEHEIAIIYYGFLYPLKGVETLITAFSQLPGNTRLLVVGGTEDEVYARSLRELSNKAGRADHILWIGHCDDEKSSLYLYTADICVLPFNMGVRLNNSSFAAAAAHSLPIVTTRGEMLEEPFIDGENLRLCPPKDPAALAEAINELISFPELRSRLRSGVQRLTEQCFAADRIISSTLRVLTDPSSVPDAREAKVRAIAFHLPQFHPIPENDEWWGKGFTEWTNVAKAKPEFLGHYQPHLPADLGFYDLRLPEARAAQAELAAEYGIHGFCHYHYWFKGRRLLGRPIDEILRTGRPDFPFCLCWANESWTRRWLGEERDVLIPQTYDERDDLDHCQWLAKAFADRRYLRVGGRPVFLIYRPGNLPEPKRLTDTLRDVCAENGDKNPYLIGVDAHEPGRDFRSDGFDTTLEFAPQLGVLPAAFYDEFSLGRLQRNLGLRVLSGNLKVYDYEDARQRMTSYVRPFPTVPCVFVGWDNTPRRGKDGIIIVNSSPQAFGRALETEVSKLRASGDEEPLLFINAWNEWAEGNHLEPCQKWGRGYLEAARKALRTSANCHWSM